MDSKVLNFKSSINISVDIQNTGNFKGKEVVQLYIKDRFASVTRPIKELKGFDLVELDIGETKTIKFQINESLLRFYSKNEVWESEPGFFDFYIGTDSNATLKNSFELIK